MSVRTITLPRRTNCYLIDCEAGFVLVDTGFPHHRAALLSALEDAGCGLCDLSLIMLTHGDIDHSGNAAYLRDTYGAQIAMHPGDAEMCLNDGETRERNTKPPGDFPKVLYLWLIGGIFAYFARKWLRGSRYEPFAPDILLQGGEDLRPFGLEATVYHTPGHSKGSISLLTPEGDLLCGDHFVHVWGYVVGSTDDPAFPSTNARLAALPVKMVYPGHGEPFPAEQARLWTSSAPRQAAGR